MIRPISLDEHKVRAILHGRMATLRLLILPQPVHDGRLWQLGGAAWSDGLHFMHPVCGNSLFYSQPCAPGDLLWVREPWLSHPITPHDPEYLYAADYILAVKPWSDWAWSPSGSMPRKAARIFLRVRDVYMEQVPIAELLVRAPQDVSSYLVDLAGSSCPWAWCIDFYQVDKPQEVTW